MGILDEGISDVNPAALIRTLRGITGLTRREFAERVDLSFETIKKIEEGGRGVSPTSYARVARIVGNEMLEFAENVTGSATAFLAELFEDGAMGDDDTTASVRLFFEIMDGGKIVFYDMDYIDEPSNGEAFILASPREAMALLKRQQEELGS